MSSTTVVSSVRRFSLCPFCWAYLALVSLAVSGAAGLAQDLSGKPAKIEISAKPLTGNNEQGVTVHVELRDPVNHLAVATKNIEIEIEGRTDKGAAEKSKVLIKQGESSASAELPVKTTGLLEVTAKNPQLAEGGTLIELRKPKRPALLVTPPATTLESLGAPVETGSAASAPAIAPSAVQVRRRPVPAAAMIERAPASVAMATPPAVALATPAPSTSSLPNAKPVFKLSYTPKRKLRAGEGDAATVWASLQGDPAPEDMKVAVWNDVGPAVVITIPKGEYTAGSKLVGTYAGAVNVGFENSAPPPSGSSLPERFIIDFGPPIWALKLVPTLPSINLFESTDVTVELLNSQGELVATDDERKALLSFDSGKGELDSNPVTFHPKESVVKARFIPTSTGSVQLRVSSDSLSAVTAIVTVGLPKLLIALCAIGSLLGGVVAFWTESAASWHRIVIGLITGFLLYWAFVFGVVHVASFAHAFVINPFSAVALSFVGGWGGTKVITLLLKPLGLEW
jgi:hypothetical protein